MNKKLQSSVEYKRLLKSAENTTPLPKWGPYLSEREWGTVREDYSAGGFAWTYLNFEDSHFKTYKWGEDGIAGISDRHQYLCFAPAFWNGKDPILKEKLFGLSNPQGNHGEDVKELYYYLDNTPTHSYMMYQYKYPQEEFPYAELIDTNAHRTRLEPEFEILDTNAFKESRYFDIIVEYAKAGEEDVCIRISVTNRSFEAADLHLLPTVWFRNIWQTDDKIDHPVLTIKGTGNVGIKHPLMPDYYFYYPASNGTLMTENENNEARIAGNKTIKPTKDAFHEAIAGKNERLFKRISNKGSGTKFAPIYVTNIAAGKTETFHFRLTRNPNDTPFDESFHQTFTQRIAEKDEYFDSLVEYEPGNDVKNIYKQAMSGLLWNKQYYAYDIHDWLQETCKDGAPDPRQTGRNSSWKHLKIADVISMPDKWEYPWFAAWDLCFQCVPMAVLDPEFAKNQMILLSREWMMNPQGQIPSYEWNFSDINPPIHAWASLLVYNIDKKVHGNPDITFLKRMFHKLSINFTWWANQEDENFRNVFSGGFLGLDNIGVIDRSSLPAGFRLEQVDATAWMGMFALNMMEMALEISQIDKSYEDMVTKFYEHFVLISSSLNNELWNKDDNYFYDLLHATDGSQESLKVRSIVGLSVLFDATIIKFDVLNKLEDFQKRMEFFKNIRTQQQEELPFEHINKDGDLLITLIQKERIIKLLNIMLDENEFLSPGGLRALSRYHLENPYSIHLENIAHTIQYLPAESDNSMFGGNSNWRGPVWLPINFLLIDTLYSLHKFYGDTVQIPFPTGSEKVLNLKQVAQELSIRIINIFTADANGARLAHGSQNWFYTRPENKDLLQFYEYFNGDNAAGLGASHQTGWTSLIAVLIHQLYDD